MDGSLKNAQKIVVGFLRSPEMTFLPLAFYLALGVCWETGCFPQQYDGCWCRSFLRSCVHNNYRQICHSTRKNGRFLNASKVSAELIGAEVSGFTDTWGLQVPFGVRDPNCVNKTCSRKKPLKCCLGNGLNRAGYIRDTSRPGWLSSVQIQLVKHAGNYLQ